MVIERSMHPQFLSNTYLVGEPGGAGFFVDAGGPVSPLIAAAERHDMTPTHVLLTHHHHDHVDELGRLTDRWPDLEVLAHPRRARRRRRPPRWAPTRRIRVGDLEVRTLHTPGHTKGMLSLLVEGNVFTGDTLFKNSVGGVRAPGHTTYADLKHSIMDVLLALPPETVIRPGHTEPTTVAEEWEHQRVRARVARPGPRGRRAVHRHGRARPRSCCSATTTTAATRPGCAGPTGPTTSSPARRSAG